MNKISIIALLILSILLWNKGYIMENAPKAKQVVHVHNYHGKQYEDKYHWLKDTNIIKSQNSEILEYIKAENKLADVFFDKNKQLLDDIYKELVGRVKLSDQSVPVKISDYSYYDKIDENQNYLVHYRTNHKTNQEELLLDENTLVKSEYMSLGAFSVSYCHNFLAYSYDLVGNERYTLKIKDLRTGELLNNTIDNVLDMIVWNSDSSGFYYVIPDDSWRPYRLYYHDIKTASNTLIYEEKDDQYRIGIHESSDKSKLLIKIASAENAEYYYSDLNNTAKMHLLYPRSNNARIYIDYAYGKFYGLVNDTGKNFRLISLENNNINEIIAVNPDIYLHGLYLYNDHIVITYRKNGLDGIKYAGYNNLNWAEVKFTPESYSADIVPTDFSHKHFRYKISALNMPMSVFEHNTENGSDSLLKTQEIPSGFDALQYEVKREFAKSYDGTMVPVSILYKKDKLKKDGSNPLYLYGYGSYGISTDPAFNRNVISLVDRGFVYAVAHIRGSDDMGFDWYQSAKFTNKWHTFNDFIACAEHMIGQKYTSKSKITIMGGSAGGMLVGAVMNKRPDLYKNVVAHVPFVDVLNTMMDSTLPLTTGEYLEWGNPNEPKFFDYIMSYSPYNNLAATNYPNIYATTSLGDTRVAYWEPAKWIAKIREIKTNNPVIIFETNLEAGHGGASGRFGYLKDKAKEYVFVITNSN